MVKEQDFGKQRGIEFFKEAEKHKVIADEIQNASLIWNGVKGISKLIHSATSTNERTLVTFLGMLGMAGVSWVVNNPELSQVSTNALVIGGGMLSGDYWKPVSGYLERREKDRVMDIISEKIERGEKVNPSDLTVLLSRSPRLISPSELNDVLRPKTDPQSKNPVFEAARKILNAKIDSDQEVKKKKELKKQKRAETIAIVMEAQNLGQIMKNLQAMHLESLLEKLQIGLLE